MGKIDAYDVCTPALRIRCTHPHIPAPDQAGLEGQAEAPVEAKPGQQIRIRLTMNARPQGRVAGGSMPSEWRPASLLPLDHGSTRSYTQGGWGRQAQEQQDTKSLTDRAIPGSLLSVPAFGWSSWQGPPPQETGRG